MPMTTKAKPKSKRLFPLGQVVMTRGINDLVEQGLRPLLLLALHSTGYWDDMDPEDQKTNAWAAKNGARVLTAIETEEFGKIWIITEADRSSTCILLPEEY